jgi:hypothetical protein
MGHSMSERIIRCRAILPAEEASIAGGRPTRTSRANGGIRMKQGQHGAPLVLGMLGATLIALTALAQSADELVTLIQQSVEDIQAEMRVDPAGAESTLALQKDRIETLRSEAPNHPMLSSLERRIDELDEEVAALRESQSESPVPEEQFVPLSAPADVRMRLRDVEELRTRGDREMLRGETDSAVAYLDEAESLIATIEEEYGDQIPPGYAALIVAKERIAGLRDQLARQQEE